MTARRVALILALVLPAAVAAGCDDGGAKNTSPNLELARPFADDFMNRLVADGRWGQVRTDVSPLIQREVRSFQKQLVKDKVRTVNGTGEIRDDCPPNVTLGTGSDCFLYSLTGKQVQPLSGKVTTIKSQMHLWVEPKETSGWQMEAYDYNAVVGQPK